MHSLLYPLNIGTLATWLSVAGVGTVGVWLPAWTAPPPPPQPALETLWLEPEITLGEPAPEPTGETPATPDPPEATPVPMPAPPEMPQLAALDPLPEVPDLPPAPEPVDPPRSRSASRTATSASRPPRPAPRASSAQSAAQGTATGAATGAMSPDARLAGGRMPAPRYPSEARRLGQTGTLVVEFTIDTSGRVISAYAKNPSPWPLLNEEAVRTVRRWKFPPGPVMKLQRPIVFQLR